MALDQICDMNQCTACFACVDLCPKGAIRQELDALKEEMPVIDSEKCISCGLCVSMCPVNNKQKLQEADFCYGAWSKREDDLDRSSSGGVAAVLSRKVLKTGGLVYGAVSRDSKIFHDRIDTEEGLELLRGSKYVKSDTKNCFNSAHRDLKEGKQVLFIGTPCQVAAAKAFCVEAGENLLTIDLICHGTPPFSYLKEYLDKCCHNGKWDSVSFRYKKSFLLRAFSGRDPVYQKAADEDLYFSAFLDGLIFRKGCYSCPYARPERIGDLTIGDFWGIDRSKLAAAYEGKISLILPNTTKGALFLEICQDELMLHRFPMEDAMNPQQGNLLHPSIMHSERENFENWYSKYGFCEAIMRTDLGRDILKREREKRIKNSLLYKTLKKIYHLVK